MENRNGTIQILIADDHEIVRDGLAGLIGREPDMAVAGSVGNGRDAVRAARELRPDVVVMDIGMPDLNGVDAARQITGDLFGARVLCLSMHRESNVVGSMLRAGATGYLVKDCAGSELIDAIRTVHSGRTYISPLIAAELVNDFVCSNGERTGSVFTDLSEREREVLQLIAEGLNTKEIADQLGISDKTVAAHRLSLMAALELHSIAEITRYAVRQGLVEP